jgi:hypothetical protein
MHRFYCAMVTCLIALAFVGGWPSGARAVDRKWEEGTVWTIEFARSKPGKFDKYIDDLSGVFRKYIEKLMRDGVVVSYKILQIPFPADDGPDLAVLIEYKNMAALDKGKDYFDGVIEGVLGSQLQVERADVDREELRSLKGSLLARELKFKD